MARQGPLRPGRRFTDGGGTTRKFRGPTRPGTDVEKFRRTGKSSGSSGGGSSGRVSMEEKRQAAARAAAAVKAAAAKAAIERALIEKTRQAGRMQLAKQQAQAKRRLVLTRRERASLSAREQLRVVAIARGRGFTKTELKRFMKQRGGSVAGLRSARRKGFRITRAEEKPERVTAKTNTKEQRIQKLISDNSKLGILTSRASATRVINARIKSENKRQTVTVGEVQRIEQPTGKVARVLKELNDLQKVQSTKSVRTKQRNLKNELSLFGLTTGLTVAAGVGAIIALPSTVVNLAKNPKQILEIPSAIARGGAEFGQLIRISPTVAFGKIAGEVILLKTSGTGFKVVGKVKSQVATRLSPRFKGVKTTSLGIKSIKVGKKTVIELNPPRGVKFKVKPLKAVREAKVTRQFKTTPVIPKLTKLEKELLKIVKKRKEIVTGSLTQETFLKKAFSKRHADIDIVSKNPQALANAIKKKLGNRVKFKSVKITDSPLGKFEVIKVFDKKTGKLIADLDPLKFAEEDFGKAFPIKKVNGIKFISPKARLAAKVKQLGRGLRGKKRAKVIRDIEDLFGKKVSLDKPAITGGFGRPIKEQKRIIGKRGTVVTAQDNFFKQAAKSASAKDVKVPKGKFDLAKIKRKILKKNKNIELDRWLFASPFDPKTGKGQLRISRLGLVEKDAKLIDIILGKDISFRRAKPQILVFPDEKIFPKIGKLSKAQIKKTKGFTVPEFSSELEVVLGKGWAIKKGKTLGKTLIDGRSVPIIEMKKIRLDKTTRGLFTSLKKERVSFNKLLKSKSKNTLSNRKLLKTKLKTLVKKEKAFNTRLKKKTGINYNVRSRAKVGKKVVNLKGIGTSVAKSIPKRGSVGRVSRAVSRKKVSRGVSGGVSRPPKRPVSRPPSRPPKRPPRRPPSRPPKRPPRRPPSRPPAKPPVKPPVIRRPIKISKKVKKLKKSVPVFDVFGKSGGKFVKLNRKPLTRNDALSKGAFAVDRTTARTFKIAPKGKTKTPGALLKDEKNYFKRQGFKLREVRIKRGRKFQLKNKYIEKSKHAIDTRSEKKGLTIAKLLRDRRKAAKKQGVRANVRRKNNIRLTRSPTKRRMNPTQRKKMLANLKKARRIRMKNLKGGKK